MTAKNDITGDLLVSRNSEAYRNNYDLIFGKKGNKHEQRSGRNDGEMVGGDQTSGTGYSPESTCGGSVQETDTYPHDRLPSDSNH